MRLRLGSSDSTLALWVTVVQQGIEVLEVQHQHQDVLGRSHLLFYVVLVKGAQVVVQEPYVCLLAHSIL